MIESFSRRMWKAVAFIESGRTHYRQLDSAFENGDGLLEENTRLQAELKMRRDQLADIFEENARLRAAHDGLVRRMGDLEAENVLLKTPNEIARRFLELPLEDVTIPIPTLGGLADAIHAHGRPTSNNPYIDALCEDIAKAVLGTVDDMRQSLDADPKPCQNHYSGLNGTCEECGKP